jgi:DNA-binding MarR family transcriptional regulator
MLRAELQEVLGKSGMYLTEYRALSRMQNREMTMGEIADELGLTPASVTDLGRQLLSRKWVVRKQSPTDLRVYRLSPTAAGVRAYRAQRREYRQRLSEVARSLSPETRQVLSDGLHELTLVLAARSASPRLQGSGGKRADVEGGAEPPQRPDPSEG